MGKFNFLAMKSLTWAYIKMFFRDRGALFWSLFFPVIIITVFGLLDFSKGGKTEIGMIYDQSTENVAQMVKEGYEGNENFIVHTNGLETELDELQNDNRTLVIEFKLNSETGKTEIKSYINKAQEQSGNFIFLATQNILDKLALSISKIEPPFVVASEVVNVHKLRNIDFMVPGVIAMSVMQAGIFGVIGTIVNYREKGILKRLFATPLSKGDFIVALIISRLVFSMAQVSLLLLFAYLVFQIKIVGSLWLVALLAILGELVFLAMGFLFSGIAKTAETARALVAPVQMILMFTGGVFYSRTILPNWLFQITKYSPLTYLADSLRVIMTRGYNLGDYGVKIAMIGISIWLVTLILTAIRTFKWE